MGPATRGDAGTLGVFASGWVDLAMGLGDGSFGACGTSATVAVFGEPCVDPATGDGTSREVFPPCCGDFVIGLGVDSSDARKA